MSHTLSLDWYGCIDLLWGWELTTYAGIYLFFQPAMTDRQWLSRTCLNFVNVFFLLFLSQSVLLVKHCRVSFPCYRYRYVSLCKNNRTTGNIEVHPRLQNKVCMEMKLIVVEFLKQATTCGAVAFWSHHLDLHHLISREHTKFSPCAILHQSTISTKYLFFILAPFCLLCCCNCRFNNVYCE